MTEPELSRGSSIRHSDFVIRVSSFVIDSTFGSRHSGLAVVIPIKRTTPGSFEPGVAWTCGKDPGERITNPGRSSYSLLPSHDLLEQLQGGLRGRVGLGQPRRRRLRQDLRTGEVRGLLGEVGVADRALGRAGVLQGDAQVVHGRTDRELLERAEAAAELADLLDGLVDHLLG